MLNSGKVESSQGPAGVVAALVVPRLSLLTSGRMHVTFSSWSTMLGSITGPRDRRRDGDDGRRSRCSTRALFATASVAPATRRVHRSSARDFQQRADRHQAFDRRNPELCLPNTHSARERWAPVPYTGALFVRVRTLACAASPPPKDGAEFEGHRLTEANKNLEKLRDELEREISRDIEEQARYDMMNMSV